VKTPRLASASSLCHPTAYQSMASQFDSCQESASLLHVNKTLADFSEAPCCQEAPNDLQCDVVSLHEMLAGNFCHEPDDTRRGVTLGTDLAACSESLFAKPCLQELRTDKFAARAAPRQVPSDCNEATSVIVDGATAADVANILYDYVSSEVRTSHVKINPEKYTIKADIFLPSEGTCTLKMCVYSQAPLGGLLVEFSRRRGDAIAFNRIFRHASAYLKCKLSNGKEPCPEMEKDLAAPDKVPMSMETDLQPLLDQLSRKGADAIQTEAAILLSAMVVVNAAVAAHVSATLSRLPGLHRLEEQVLFCASRRCSEIITPSAAF